MGCRDMGKCEEAAKEIRGKTLNPHVYACHLDLASMKSIREFAERIKQGEETKLIACSDYCHFSSYVFSYRNKAHSVSVSIYNIIFIVLQRSSVLMY